MTIALRFDAIPDELKALPQWVLWRYETREGKPTKPPHQVSGKYADSTKPETWTTFERARAAMEAGGFEGIGFALSDGDAYTAFDLDHCRDAASGEIEPWAREVVDAVNSYTEITPSDEGLRILVRATLPPGGRKKDRPGFHLEVYDRARYVTLTGQHLAGTPSAIEDRSTAVEQIHAAHFDTPPAVAPTRPPQPVVLDDAALLDRARGARNGAKFDHLFSGDWRGEYESQSQADQALCNALAFWTGRDAGRMDRLFRASGLMRDKWDRPARSGESYGDGTIQRACESAVEVYTETPRPSANGPHPANPAERIDPRPLDRFSFTDTGNAERFAARFGDRARYDHRRSRWLVWAKHWWRPDADAEVRRMAKNTARAILREAADLEDDEKRKLAIKWAIDSESRARLDAMLDLAQAEHPIADAGDNWDTGPWLLGVANGVLNLRTGDLRAGVPEDRITLHTDTPFEPDAECPRWLQFLQEVFAGDAEIIDYVHRAAGYSLTGDTSEQCFFEGYGSGANGKSTMLAILRETLGAYAHNMPFSTVELRGRQEQTFDLADLAGCRLVTASETSESARLNEARVKALTGEDPVTARHPYAKFETFTPTLKLWLGVNHRPQVDDDSHAFWRRVRLIPFTVRFDGARRDNDLKAKLRAELSGILAWLVRGCLAWHERGLDPPASVSAATEQYRQDSDKLADFIAACCFIRPDVTIPASALYRAYLEWAKAEGIRDREQLSSTAFGRRMGERFEKRRMGTGNVYVGVALLTSGQGAFSEDADGSGGRVMTSAEPFSGGPAGSQEAASVGLSVSEVYSSDPDPRLFSSPARVENFTDRPPNPTYPTQDDPDDACQECGTPVDYRDQDDTPWCVQHGPGPPS